MAFIEHIDVINFLIFLFRSRFLRFLAFFLFLHVFLFLKTLWKPKYEYAKIQRETLLGDASATIFIDFGLLRSSYCKISYLFAEERWFGNCAWQCRLDFPF